MIRPHVLRMNGALVEAVQVTPANKHLLAAQVGGRAKTAGGIVFDTPDGARVTADPGDYIIRTTHGTFHKLTAEEYAAAEKEGTNA